MLHTLLRLALPVFVSAPLAAATLTVGPGGAFAEIADAVAAAQPGDTILVEPGAYGAFTVNKPLSILATGPGVAVATLGLSGLVVDGIGAGEEVVISGLEIQSSPIFSFPQASIRVSDSPGSVVLHDVRVVSAATFTGVHVEDVGRLALLDAQIIGTGPGASLVSLSSEVWLADSVLGGAVLDASQAPGPHGADLTDSTLFAWRSRIEGATIAGGIGGLAATDGGDGLRALGSEVVLYGGSGSTVLGGDGGPAGPFFGPGAGGVGLRLEGGSSARIQSDVVIEGGIDEFFATGAAILSDGSSTEVFDPTVFPTLTAAQPRAAVDTPFSLTAEGSPGALVVLYASLGTGPTLSLSGVEGLGLLQPTFFVQAGVQVLSGGGSATFDLQAGPAFAGSTVFFQAYAAGFSVPAITGPSLVILTP